MITQTIELLITAPAFIKVGVFFGMWLLCWLPLAVPTAIALQWHPFQPITEKQKLPLLATLYFVAPLLVWGWASLEGQSLADYGLPLRLSVLRSLAIGLVVGVVGLGLLFALEQRLGWVQWRSPQLPQTASVPNGEFTEPTESTEPKELTEPLPSLSAIWLPTLLIGLWVGFTEELVFRGFLINLLHPLGAIASAAIASVIFALLHLVWEGRTTMPQLPGLWLMGMVLVLARWVDGGNLGLAWGLHAGWVWAIASLDTAHCLTYGDRVPAWVTGIAGKPLAGMMGISFLLLTGMGLRVLLN